MSVSAPTPEVPADWDIAYASEVCEVQNGYAFKSKFFNDKSAGLPLIRIRDVHSGRSSTFYSGPFDEKYVVTDDDLLIGMDGEFRVRKWSSGKGLLNQRVCRLIPNSKLMIADFLYYSIGHPLRQIENFTPFTTVKHISASQIRAIELPLPPLPEQKKIAHILSTVQRAIEAQERIIQTTTELKKSLMQKLFTEGLRGEKQKETEIGLVPESWEVVELNQLADLKNGYAFKSKDYVEESNTLNIRMSNIRPSAQFDLEYNPRYLPDHFAETQKSFLLEDGDLIIAMTDMANDPKILGVPTIVRNPSDKKLLLNQRVGKLVPTGNNRVDFEFLRFYLSRKSVQHYLVSCAKKGVQVNIGKKDILSVHIAFPKPDEQEKIVQCLNILAKKIAAAENKGVALQHLFRTLLHELMTAKRRVHEIESLP